MRNTWGLASNACAPPDRKPRSGGAFFFHGVLALLQRCGILDRREVARVAALADGLDRTAQELPPARLREQRDEADARRTRDGAKLPVHGCHDFLLVRGGELRRRRLR